ncbi:hypothetical protein M0802_013176 [Mischocyttarus mexicanus]|nr:hypothetical protein M0802_013176 [Mischocyttarus mexicanus]
MVETNIVSNISSAKKISWSSNGLILGAGELVKTRKERYKVKYNFSLSPNSIKRSSYLLKTVDYAIRRFVNDCLEKEIINKTESIVKENLKNVLVKNEVSSSAPSSTDNLDLNLNNLFDVLIDSAIDFIKNYNLEKIDLPNINESIEIKFLLFSITPQLETFDGTFNGLTTLKRITDSILTRENHKYIISSGFDISNIFIDMKYKLTYGNLIHKFGSMFSTAKNIAIKSKISVNYNVPRCIIDLEELKISKLTKFEIKLGGPDVAMDSLTSTIINTLTDHFNNFSRTLIENNLKDFLKNKLEFVDCEKYRTKIIG